ncbi:hypothetical protein KBD59_02640 [Candidatus Gracilibacteria bacterium]|nr:hypothetical protein [Candidatus Gracilibacteria bacterium]
MKKLSFLSIAVISLFLLAACTQTSPTPTPSTDTPVTPVTPVTPPVEPIISPLEKPFIYTENIRTTDANNRGWPTERIWVRSETTEPKVLVEEIGKVGEYPNSYDLSPDGKKLYVNLESKLEQIDIATGARSTLFTPKKQVNNLIFSSDGKTMFIWDQIYASPNDFGFYLHKIDLGTGTATTLASGDTGGKYMFISAIRDADTVILQQALGEASRAWFLTVKDGKIHEIPGASGDLYLSISSNGRYVATVEKTIPNICNDFSGSEASLYILRDSVTGEKIRTLGEMGKGFSRLSYAADGSEVIYATAPPYANVNECETPRTTSYYRVKTTKDALPVAITEAQADTLHREWYPNNSFDIKRTENAWEVSRNGKKLFEVPLKYDIVRL